MGNYSPCNRKGCRHDLHEHRRAPTGNGGIFVGACQHGDCLCSQYVGSGLTVGNRVTDQYGDHGLGRRPPERQARRYY